MSSEHPHIIVRRLGLCDYRPVWETMCGFSAARTASTPDEIWLVEHTPVYTLGLNAKREHVLSPSAIPVVHTDRGGQVTYHGPGQLVAYLLLDLRRRALGVRQLVNALEQSVIELLADYNVPGEARREAPGVYVNGAKIAALGLRVRQGCSYHGVSLNVAMDLEPFTRIHPCGHADLHVTDMRSLGITAELSEIGDKLAEQIGLCLEYTLKDGDAPPIGDGEVIAERLVAPGVLPVSPVLYRDVRMSREAGRRKRPTLAEPFAVALPCAAHA